MPQSDRVSQSDRVLRLAALLGVLWVLLYAGLTWATRGSPGPARWVANAVYLVPLVIAVVTSGAAAARGRVSAPSRRMWFLLTGALGLWLIGEVIWSWYAFTTGSQIPYPSVADVFYLGSCLLALPALLLGFKSGLPLRRLRAGLDSALVSLGVGSLGWRLIQPILDADLALAGLVVGVLYPLADVAILVLLLSLGFCDHRRMPLSVRLVGVAYLTLAVSDTGYVLLSAQAAYTDDSWVNIGYQVAAVLLAYTGLLVARRAEPCPQPQELGVDLTLIPLGVSAASVTVLVTVENAEGRVDTGYLVVAGLVLAGTLGRQLLITHERTRLARQLREALREQRWLATTDPLTHLPNRRAFQQRLAAEVVRADRTGQPLSLVVIDLDHFKRINDGHGHAVGDAVLVQAADRLRRVVPPEGVLARHGGEEFSCLLPAPDRSGAARLAERLRASLASEPARVGGQDIPLSGSLGVATTHPAGDVDGDTLAREADRALYQAKAAGRNLVVTAQEPSHLLEQTRQCDGDHYGPDSVNRHVRHIGT